MEAGEIDPNPQVTFQQALAAANALERILFRRLIWRCAQGQKLRWVNVVNRAGVKSATRVALASRWGSLTAFTGLAASGLLSQPSIGPKVVGYGMAGAFAISLLSYLVRMCTVFRVARSKHAR